AGAIAAIEDKEYFEETTEKIIATRERTARALDELGFTVLPSSANFLFVTHPAVGAKELYERLRENNILIRYFGSQHIEQYVRITIGTDEEMRKLMDAIEEIVE